MINQKLLLKYNTPDSLIVISSYPKKAEQYSKGVCAVAGFTKNTLHAIRETAPGKKIVVLTMQLGKKQEVYEEDGMLIIRCFERNRPLSYRHFFTYARLFSRIKSILIEFEFASFGDTFTTGLLLPFTWSLILLRKRIVFVAHQVVFDLNQLTGHIGMTQSTLKIKIFNLLLPVYYAILFLPARSIIVLEEYLKKRLSSLISGKKISVIPHGVDTSLATGMTQNEAKQRLGLKHDELVILYFGYLAWYKGADFLIESLEKTAVLHKKKIRLILAGGPSFTQEKKPHYQKFIEHLMHIANKTAHITITGFVEEKSIATYFKSADVVLFPYRTFMSSSGPLSIAFAMQKPVLLSANLAPLLATHDITDALTSLGLSKQDVLFPLQKQALLTKLTHSLKRRNLQKLQAFSRKVGESRAFSHQAEAYLNEIATMSSTSYEKKPVLLFDNH